MADAISSEKTEHHCCYCCEWRALAVAGWLPRHREKTGANSGEAVCTCINNIIVYYDMYCKLSIT